MTENRLDDYLDHMRQAASDALIFVEGLNPRRCGHHPQGITGAV